MTFFYGLQHRRLSVKKAHAGRDKCRGIERLRVQAWYWPTCSKRAEPGQFVTRVSRSRARNLNSPKVQPSLAVERASLEKDL
jgi:hypothetical protein